MKFYIGLHQPADAQHFDRAFISINRVRGRKKPVPCKEWILDSGAFSELSAHGRYRHSVAEYAGEIGYWRGKGIVAAVAQDYMCDTALTSKFICQCLHSADSMAWSFAARRQDRDPNDWREARDFIKRIAMARTHHARRNEQQLSLL